MNINLLMVKNFFCTSSKTAKNFLLNNKYIIFTRYQQQRSLLAPIGTASFFFFSQKKEKDTVDSGKKLQKKLNILLKTYLEITIFDLAISCYNLIGDTHWVK